MAQYEWRTVHVQNKAFANKLQDTLNALEGEGFIIDDIMDAPDGRSRGVIVVAKKPRDRKPATLPARLHGAPPR